MGSGPFGRRLGQSLQRLSHGGAVLGYVMLVPSLLVVVRAILLPIGVAETDVPYVFADEPPFGRPEVVLYLGAQQRIVSRQNLHKPALARSVVAYDGNLLALGNLQIQRLGHAPVGMAGDAVFYAYQVLMAHNS